MLQVKIIKNLLSNLDYKECGLKVITAEATYYFDTEKETLIEESSGMLKELGCGKIVVKTNFKKATTSKEAQINI